MITLALGQRYIRKIYKYILQYGLTEKKSLKAGREVIYLTTHFSLALTLDHRLNALAPRSKKRRMGAHLSFSHAAKKRKSTRVPFHAYCCIFFYEPFYRLSVYT